MHSDFQQVETWIFDLDNTLYPPHERLFGQIEAKISAYVQRELGVDATEAHRLRRAYWHDHGTTLAGLMIHHRIDPEPFLDEVHDIDFTVLDPDAALRAGIAALPGRKLVYTNGARTYAARAVAALGLADLFDRIWTIEDAFYTPKPQAAAFQRIFGADGLDPKRAAFFEDDHRNLAVPHRLGVRTVLVTGKAGMSSRSAPEPVLDTAGTAPLAALAPEAAVLARTAPITPPAPEVPAHVDHVTSDLPGFLAAVQDPASPLPGRG